MKDKNRLFFFQLIFFILMILIIQIFIINNELWKTVKHTSNSKAQTPPFFGFNIHSLPLLTAQEIYQLLSMVSQCHNSTVIRFWGFSGSGDNYQTRLSNAIENIDKVLKNSPTNIRFIITLSNYYSQGVFQPWPAAENNPSRWFGNDWKINGFANFVETVTAKYKNNPKILMWEIMNEPNCTLDDDCIKNQHRFLQEVSDLIAKNDSEKLISPGLQGQNTGGENFDNGDYEKITQLTNISANSCHLYIGPYSLNSNLSKINCLRALEITKSNNKFFYIGELGGEYGCTSDECTNTCSTNTLEKRKNDIMAVAKELTDAGAGGILIWQFSPERNATLTCDGFSIFPDDPFCSITGPKTLTDTKKSMNNQQQNQVTNITTINFNPQNPIADTPFKVIINSTAGFIWVHIKIFDKDGKKLIQEGKKTADQPKVSKTNNVYQWLYDIQGVPTGDYKIIFYSNCHQGCKEQSSRILSVRTGKNNDIQNIQSMQKQELQPTQESNLLSPTQPQLLPKNAIKNIDFSSGKITFLKKELAAMGITEPRNLEYCQRCATKDAGCKNPHNQEIGQETVTMSIPTNPLPAAFCSSIPMTDRPNFANIDKVCLCLFN